MELVVRARGFGWFGCCWKEGLAVSTSVCVIGVFAFALAMAVAVVCREVRLRRALQTLVRRLLEYGSRHGRDA
jgi:hypothetical protein